MNLEKYKNLKEKLDQMKSSCDRSEGALLQLESEIKSKFNCESVEKAKIISEKITEENKQLKLKCEKMLQDFQEKWNDKIESIYD